MSEHLNNKDLKVAVVTLGCKLNFAESSSIAQEFIRHGFREVSANSVADVYVVNTCTVTEHSDKKCRNLIRKVHKTNPDAIVLVTGCYAELKKDEVSNIEGVSAVLGQKEKSKVYNKAKILLNLEEDDDNKVNNSGLNEDLFPAASFGERTRSFLKIQDGCDYYCTYCAIPFARGRSRAVSPEIVLSMARDLANKGVKEIVLTGINLGDYTRVSNGISLLQLLKQLNDIEGIFRYRISSIEPNLLTNELIDWIAVSEKFQPHFHIPLQSGCDQTLKRMNRKYDTKLFKSKIEYIRSKIDDPFFGIDVIVGFPGETDEEFETTYNFLNNEIKPSFLHIFPYSRRAETKAFTMENQVPADIKNLRVKRLEELSEELHKTYIKRYSGTTQKVLFESSIKNKNGMLLIEGYTGNYIRVTAPYDSKLIGTIKEITI